MATPAEAQSGSSSPHLGARERARRFCRGFGLRVPILQAPMAGACPASLARRNTEEVQGRGNFEVFDELFVRGAEVRARVAQLQAEIAERAVEIAAIDKSWVMRRLQENVERAMSIEPVLDGKGHPTVYDPEPAEEPLPGTVKGMGIEVGINARPLWPGGVLVDALHAAEAMRRTKALIAGPTVPAIFEARSAR